MKLLCLSCHLFLVILLCLAGHVAQAQTCTLSLDAFKGVLDDQSKMMSDYKKQFTQTNETTREFKETAKFAEGIGVSFSVSGCEHVYYVLTYETITPPPTTSAQDYLVQTTTLMEKTPFKKDRSVMIDDVWLRALKKTQEQKGQIKNSLIKLDCGMDALCTLDVSQTTQLKLTYDFAL